MEKPGCQGSGTVQDSALGDLARMATRVRSIQLVPSRG